MTDLDLIRAAVVKSGLSHSAFAREIVARDPRQVRRWLSGKHPIPQCVRAFLTRYLDTP